MQVCVLTSTVGGGICLLAGCPVPACLLLSLDTLQPDQQSVEMFTAEVEGKLVSGAETAAETGRRAGRDTSFAVNNQTTDGCGAWGMSLDDGRLGTLIWLPLVLVTIVARAASEMIAISINRDHCPMDCPVLAIGPRASSRSSHPRPPAFVCWPSTRLRSSTLDCWPRWRWKRAGHTR